MSLRLPSALAALLALGVWACASYPQAGLAPTDTQWAELRRIGVRDLQPEFSQALCIRMTQAGLPCENGQHSILATPTRQTKPAHPTVATGSIRALPNRFRVGIVPGLFASCLPHQVRPLADAAAHLRARGFEVLEFNVDGRGSVLHNGRQIAAQLHSLPPDPRPLLMFGYSKGLIDILEALADQPTLQQQIAAIVGWAGAANGSLLAEKMESLYRASIAHLPIGSCGADDTAAIHDLTPAVRRLWWSHHGSEIRVPLFSTVGLPLPERLSPALRPGYRRLAETDPRNDGQLLWRDAIMAPGFVLGFVNADHWAMGVSLTSAFPWLGSVIFDDLPRALLMEAAIDVVAAELARRR